MQSQRTVLAARAAWALGLLGWLVVSCVASGPQPAPPVPGAASEAFARARGLRDQGGSVQDPELLQALAEARALAPDWLAPARMEDDLLVEGLRGPEALERRRLELVDAQQSAEANYLVARLEGRAGGQRFARAAALDPGQAWVHLGLAWWESQTTRDQRRQVQQARLAAQLAREPWERAFLELRLATLQLGLGLETDALETLDRCVGTGRELGASDRAWLQAEVALLELDTLDVRARTRGFERALACLSAPELSTREVERLSLKISSTSLVGTARDPLRELELALAQRGGEQSHELRARLLLGVDTPLSRALLTGEGEPEWGGLLSRLTAFERGWFRPAVEAWLAALPAQALSAEGLPRRSVLAEVVQAARALSTPPDRDELERLAHALLAAGWYPEAAAVADHFGGLDPGAALELRERAAGGEALVEHLQGAVVEIERGQSDLAAEVRADSAALDPGAESSRQGDLEDLLRRWTLSFERFGALVGVRSDGLRETPRQEFGPLGSLLHPGPLFSAADEAEGLGVEGQPVPGLAMELEQLGRFAIVGQVAGGGGPDGTILRLLHLEERAGSHLGTPWRGSVAWCEGTDLLSRAGRQGARVAGAALHEGYWIDVAVVRRDLGRWRDLAQRFGAPESQAALEAALAVRGAQLLTPRAHAEQRARERRQLFPLLGEADRVRLAVLAERATQGETLGEVTLDELVAAVARHEEGHLCDRTRFLPLTDHLGAALLLLLDTGLSPRAVQQRLEYRAHLTALCVAADPRLPLVEALDTAETTSDAMPHGAAYRQLLRDLVRRLDEGASREPARWPQLDFGRTLVHQLHLLSAEELRALALELAQLEGLAR